MQIPIKVAQFSKPINMQVLPLEDRLHGFDQATGQRIDH